MAVSRRYAAALAFVATASITAQTAGAVELPASVAPAAVYETEKAQDHRWDPRYRRDRVDAGDILAGVLILGTIAAVASAAQNANRGPDNRYPENRYPGRGDPYEGDRWDYRSDSRGYDESRGLDRAADMCVAEVERGRDAVGSVDSVNRSGAGWSIQGRLENGAPFDCDIDNNGRVRVGSGLDQGYRPTAQEDRQYGDDVYARARMAQAPTQPGVAPPDGIDNRPVWSSEPPPLPSNGDGRYGVSQTPDFEQVGG